MNGARVIDTSSCDPDWERVDERWPQMYWPFENKSPRWVGEHIVGTGIRMDPTAWDWVEHG